ncbi:MAG: GAF domain-containing protein [Deltaproteobacteria bacterium]|nr:GAF domain-containing protein [Deltaproteobacteria bacterium]
MLGRVREPLTPTVHARGDDRRLDAVLDLVAYTARPRPLSTSLDELPRRIAQVFPADVCSIYLVEGDDLVMRGNVGFPSEALGDVRLTMGEGITGLAVECMRPISLDAAPAHTAYRHFEHLGEERFPIFLAMPILGPSGPLGALVLQRRDTPAFSAGDLELAAALTAPVAALLERAHLTDALRGWLRPGLETSRRVTLSGRPAVRGRAVGPACALRRPAARPTPDSPRSPEEILVSLEQAIGYARRTLGEFKKRAATLGQQAWFLDVFQVILDDARLRERIEELAREGVGLTQALGRAATEAARAATRRGDDYSVERASAINDTYEALAMLATSDGSADVPRGAILVGDQLTVFDLIVSARSQPAAVALRERCDGAVARALFSLIGAPTVVDVGALFRWVSDGDLLLVDGDHGLVRVNPSRAEVSRLREERKRGPTDQAADG